MPKPILFISRYWRSILFLMFSFFLFTHNFHGAKAPGGIPYFDKIVHFCLFSGLIFITLFDSSKVRPDLKYWIIFSILSYGVGIEVFQGLFLPYRSGNVLDIVADSAGVAVGVLCFNIYKNSRLYKPAVK